MVVITQNVTLPDTLERIGENELHPSTDPPQEIELLADFWGY